MTLHSFYVTTPNICYDPKASHLKYDYHLANSQHKPKPIASIRSARGYYLLSNSLTSPQCQDLATKILCDPITETISINHTQALTKLQGDFYAEVSFQNGITDNTATTLRLAINDLSYTQPIPHGFVFSSSIYIFSLLPQKHSPSSSLKNIRTSIEAFLRHFVMNPLIENLEILSHKELTQEKFFPASQNSFRKCHAIASPKEPLSLSNPSIPITKLSAKELTTLSENYHLHLSLAELHAIQKYYRKNQTTTWRAEHHLPAEPTQTELEALAQTWSEHCKHKIFNATITLHQAGQKPQRIHSLYRQYIQKLTHKLAQTRDDLLSVFSDNAGVFAFTDDWSIAMKVETHNTPAALDPFGGALTGIVGVNRDILGTGIGAKPLFNTNVFCLADPRLPKDHTLPLNVHHPRRMLRGVHAGVKHGGNSSGIPTVNGAIVFDDRFLARPLVFCGTGGLIERRLHNRDGVSKPIQRGDYIVTAGGHVGRDGIHGATASSSALSSTSPSSIVQIGDPITQKKLSDFLIAAKEQNLFSTLTDNGAGGLSSSVGELALHTDGAFLDLAKVPLKVTELKPWEILVSEAQERMTLVVPPNKWNKLKALASLYDTSVAHIGHFSDTGAFIVAHGQTIVAALPLKFLHDGLPTMELTAKLSTIPPSPASALSIPKTDQTRISTNLLQTLTNKQKRSPRPTSAVGSSLASLKDAFLPLLTAMLERGNIASKEYWVRQYDHEVKGRTVVKPMSGANGHGVNDAAVLRPLLDKRKALAIACGIAPRYHSPDAFHMATGVVDEALRNLVAVGTDPRTVVGLDNFAWPDPLPSPQVQDSPHKIAQLVRCVQGLSHACLAYKIPLISGKDSMKNDAVLQRYHPETEGKLKGNSPPPKIIEEHVSIPPTLLFTALGTFPDIAYAVTAPFKPSSATLYLAGINYDELGHSEYAGLLDDLAQTTSPQQTFKKPLAGRQAWTIPTVRCKENLDLYLTIYRAMTQKLIAAAHDLSDGGLLVALSEAAIGGLSETDVSFDSLSLHTPLATASQNSQIQNVDFDALAYGESHGRLILQVENDNKETFEKLFAPLTKRGLLTTIGKTCYGRRHEPALNIHWHGQILRAPLRKLRHSWLHALAE